MVHGDTLLRNLLERGLTVFSIDEARSAIEHDNISAASIPGLLMRLERQRRVSRIRRGLYAMAGSSHGMASIHPFAIAVHLVRPSAISHWSALHYHGLTEQVPRIVTASTPTKVVTPEMRMASKPDGGRKHAWTVQGVRYEFTTVKGQHFFGVEQVWVDENNRVPITDRERTVLELFVSPRVFGGIGEGIGVLDQHLTSLSVQKLVRYALQHGTISAAKRLGWALEEAGADSQDLEPLADVHSTGYHLLDPSGPRSGTRVRKWMIQNNLQARLD